METIKILVVDECPDDLAKVRSYLESRSEIPKFAVTVTENLADTLKLRDQQDFDVILSDLNLPDSESEETLSRLRAAWPSTPIVIFSGLIDEELSATLVRQGAQDYLCKNNITPDSVYRCIILSLERYNLTREISDRASAIAEVERIAHLGSWERDFKTKRNRWSDELYRIFGVVPKSVPDTFSFVIKNIFAEDKKNFLEQVKSVRTARGSFTIEFRIVRQDGSIRNLLTRAEVVSDKYRNPIRVRGTTQDITELKRAEADVLSAQQEAERASQTKSQFLATMSHEIRTPMNGVIGMTSLLRQTKLTAEQKEFVDTIRSSGEHLIEIINDILDFSKIESGKIELEKTQFNIRQIVEETVNLFSEVVAKKQIFLTDILDPKIPIYGVGDPTRIRQILVNLVSNAVKFTKQGEIIIRARAVSRNNQLIQIVFEVSDTGVGIETDKISKLFQPFSQVDGSITRRFGGTGLGLVITKNLVELMGGSIEVRSALGEGTTFQFGLSLENSHDDVGFVPRPEWSAKTIAIISSNPRAGSYIAEQLSSRGCNVKLLDNKLSRTWKGQLTHVDLILCDFKKDDRFDLRLKKIIQNSPVIEKIPRVLLTYSGTCDADRSSYSHVIKKPTKQSEIYQKIAEILNPEILSFDLETPSLPLFPRVTQDSIILVAEDNYVNQRVVGHMLTRLGYRFDTVANGLEAVDAVKKVPYDAVIMDCQMPEMDGFEATRSIRKLKLRRIPIIAVTANAFNGEAEKCLAAGMDHYISKPLRFEDLEKVLNRYLSTANTKLESFQPKNRVINSPEVKPAVDIKFICKNLDLNLEEGKEFANELFTLFLDLGPSVYDQIRSAAAENNAQLTSKLAHKLRGMTLNLGAFDIAKICEKIELQFADLKYEKMADDLQNLDSEFKRLMSYLQKNAIIATSARKMTA